MEPARNHRGHETSDARLSSVAILVAFTVGLVLVGLISMWFLYGFIMEREASRDLPPSPLAGSRAPYIGPTLQVSPPRDMKELKAAEQEVLGSYGWIDREAGLIRIPIERAMDLLAERGLPVRETPSASVQE